MPSVKLPRPLVNQLLHQAQLGADHEICGLIGAWQGVPAHGYPVTNTAAAPKSRFAMDPKGQIDAMRQMRERDEDLFAIYHTHPASPALPSAIDLAEAAYPEALYLIISLNTQGVLEMRGFRLKNQNAEEVALELQD
ncbi:MAG: M67 family metallopeptidase [Gammaproteobacteria bacterium]|nr:M67 family metallopeptidase [Gammaproteobacteria bacterium]